MIESLYTKISKDENDINELYTNPTIIELNKCLDKCKSLIYNAKKICTDNNKDELMSETNATNQTINLKEENTKIYGENNMNTLAVSLTEESESILNETKRKRRRRSKEKI